MRNSIRVTPRTPYRVTTTDSISETRREAKSGWRYETESISMLGVGVRGGGGTKTIGVPPED